MYLVSLSIGVGEDFLYFNFYFLLSRMCMNTTHVEAINA
uniref:Uncharacterized protein n=1 Tax=Rhizophora mucronata TaxID=61149 RepID=A0A2P2Q4Q0_RHIMU